MSRLLTQELDKGYTLDYNELKKEYAAVVRNTTDFDGFKTWFLMHPELTIHQHAAISGLSRPTIDRRKRKVGLTKPTKTHNPSIVRSYQMIDVPPNWDNDWLVKQYSSGISISTLVNAVGLTKGAIGKRLKKVGAIFRKKLRSCNTKEWLQKHYVEKGLSTYDCMKLAGVGRIAFMDWLVRHNIRIRHSAEANYERYMAKKISEKAKTAIPYS